MTERHSPTRTPHRSHTPALEAADGREARYAGSSDGRPVSHADWQARAAAVLDGPVFDYIAGGAGGEATMRANLEAFERRRLRPRMLAGAAQPDLSAELLGTPAPASILLAPIGVLELAHPDADLAVARAAAATGTPMIASTQGSRPMELVAEALGPTPGWFQLYPVRDHELIASLVRRAEAAGYCALVVTLDTTTLGWRDRDLRNGFLPFLTGWESPTSARTPSSAQGSSGHPSKTRRPPEPRSSGCSQTRACAGTISPRCDS